MILGTLFFCLGSLALSVWVDGVVLSESAMSMNCSSVGFRCARTSVCRSVGWRRDMKRGEMNCSFP